jgi:hypothetical protein
MTRHLAKCLAAHEQTAAAPGRPAPATGKLFHLLVQGKGMANYWLHLEVPATATLKNLDAFLRHIWLECCGHLSAFTIRGVRYSVDADAADPFDLLPRERNMEVPLGKVLTRDLKCIHEYDFGTTTLLELKVLGERIGPIANEHRVKLLARNEPPAIVCGKCGQPAAWVGVWEDDSAVCEECLGGRDEGFLPVVNSPRMGVCGYTG